MAPAGDLKAEGTPPASVTARSRDNDRTSSSSSSSAAVMASPQTETEENSPPRQKKWATKTRTGCITCRIRRVKCDEAKPMCKRCMSSGRMCDGYKAAPKKPTRQNEPTTIKTESPIGSWDPAQVAYWSGKKSRYSAVWANHEPAYVLLPPDWDLMEAFDYYYRAMLPSLLVSHLDDTTVAYMPTAGNLGCKTSFITFVFSNRIADAAKNRGSLRSPEDMPNDQYLWTTFHESMVNMLAIINQRLSSPEGAINDSVFVRIVDMLSIDLTLLGSTWQAHLHGYGALYKMRGGYKRLSRVLSDYNRQFQYVFMLHVLTSTTTPASEILPIFDDLTPDEIHQVFTFSLYSDVPCSSHLFADLIRINRLRALVAAGASVKSFVRPATRQVYRHIAEFSTDGWEEPYGVPDKPEVHLLCRIFQQTILLYGLLTLPPLVPTAAEEAAAEQSSNLLSPDTSGAEAGAGTHESDDGDEDDDGGMLDDDVELVDATPPPSVPALREEIIALMHEVLPLIPKRPTSLAWPLAVIGATLTQESDVAERAFVEKTLTTISTHRDAYYGPTLALEKLRAFWASGKTGWEDCFDEPCSVLA